MNTIFDSILEDHVTLRDLMKTMTSSTSTTSEREKAFKEFAVELEAHASAEERFLYSPVLMHDEALEKARHATSEHDEAEEIVKAMKELNPKGTAFREKAKKLVKEVKHHMKEEEDEFFKVSDKVLTTSEEKKLSTLYAADFLRLKKKFALKK